MKKTKKTNREIEAEEELKRLEARAEKQYAEFNAIIDAVTEATGVKFKKYIATNSWYSDVKFVTETFTERYRISDHFSKFEERDSIYRGINKNFYLNQDVDYIIRYILKEDRFENYKEGDELYIARTGKVEVFRFVSHCAETETVTVINEQGRTCEYSEAAFATKKHGNNFKRLLPSY